jgi:hypothetical protein
MTKMQWPPSDHALALEAWESDRGAVVISSLLHVVGFAGDITGASASGDMHM